MVWADRTSKIHISPLQFASGTIYHRVLSLGGGEESIGSVKDIVNTFAVHVVTRVKRTSPRFL